MQSTTAGLTVCSVWETTPRYHLEVQPDVSLCTHLITLTPSSRHLVLGASVLFVRDDQRVSCAQNQSEVGAHHPHPSNLLYDHLAVSGSTPLGVRRAIDSTDDLSARSDPVGRSKDTTNRQRSSHHTLSKRPSDIAAKSIPHGQVNASCQQAQMSTSPTLSFPSPASSTAETSLPTPDQPYEPYTRRSSLASLDMGMNMSPPPVPDYTPKRPIRHEVYETPTTQSRFDASMGPGALSGSPGQVPPPSQPGSNNSSAFMQNLSQRRSATDPTPTYRAAPPPPILLRRPTDINTSVVVEDIALRTGSSTSSGRRTPISPGGLNISGVPGLSEPLDREEESDLLPELAPSPHRAFFGGSSSAGAPASPAWQSFETNPNAPSSNGSPTASGPHRVRQSLDVPYSPLGPRTRDRFEPTPNHGLHSRNLSLYFPQPGESSSNGSGSQGALITSPEEIQDGVLEGQQGVANAGREKTPFGGTSNWSFGGKASAQAAGLVTPDASKKSKRRGHHVSSYFAACNVRVVHVA
jgi:hypothetical protein